MIGMVRYRDPKCYYCICTACRSLRCPWHKKFFGCCYGCMDRHSYRPRLDCDFFLHFRKRHHYRVERVTYPLIPLYKVRIRDLGEFEDIDLETLQRLSRGHIVDRISVSRVIQDKSNK